MIRSRRTAEQNPKNRSTQLYIKPNNQTEQENLTGRTGKQNHTSQELAEAYAQVEEDPRRWGNFEATAGGRKGIPEDVHLYTRHESHLDSLRFSQQSGKQATHCTTNSKLA